MASIKLPRYDYNQQNQEKKKEMREQKKKNMYHTKNKHVVTYFDNEKGRGNKSPNPDGERKHFS